MISSNGIPKSGYRAMQLLARSGDAILYNSDGIAITKKDKRITIYLYNYTTYNDKYRYQHIEDISQHNRYSIYMPKNDMKFSIEITNLAPGVSTIVTHSINRHAGSAYDKWVEMGAPQNMDAEETNYLLSNSLPQYKIERIAQNGTLRIERTLEPHSVMLIEVE